MRCPVCFKGELTKAVKKQTYEYKDKYIDYDVFGNWCDKCGEGVLEGKDLIEFEKDFEDFKKGVDESGKDIAP